MKIKTFTLLLILLAVLAACEMPAPDVMPPEEAISESGIESTSIPIFPSNTPEPSPTAAEPTDEPIPAVTDTPMPPSPTPTSPSIPTSEPSEDPTETPPAFSTVQPGDFDPEYAYGPAWINEHFLSDQEWAGATGSLPDTTNIRLEIVDGELRVTAKKLQWDTWYFSWPTLEEFYIEMRLDSGQCAGKDSYGLIFRGSASGEPSHGYAVAFSCDGYYRVIRIDNGDPYAFTELIGWTASESLRTGPNQDNVVGILGERDTFSIYANGHHIGTFVDDWYSFGRYGVFINAGNSLNYTYRVDQMRVWRNLD